MYWVYKCNNSRGKHQRWYGDWVEDAEYGSSVFSAESSGKAIPWGTLDVPGVNQLRKDDVVLAYQTERNELVGVATVEGFEKGDRGIDLMLKAVETIGVKVWPLKVDKRIADLHAFRTREIKTIYRITANDAEYLLKVARKAKLVGQPSTRQSRTVKMRASR